MVSTKKGRGRGRGRSRSNSARMHGNGSEIEDGEFSYVYQKRKVSLSQSSTPKIIRTLGDGETFTTPNTRHSHGTPLIRRVVEYGDVDTPIEQQTAECTQSSGRSWNPIMRTLELVNKDVSDSPGKADSRNSTKQIIGNNVGRETFTSPIMRHSHGTPLIRRIVEDKDVDTPREQHTDCTRNSGSGTNLSHNNRTPELANKDHSESQGNTDFGNPILQPAEAPSPMHNPLYLTEKDVDMDDIFGNALVTGRTNENKAGLQSQNNSVSLMEASAVNMPTMDALPWHVTQENALHSQEEDNVVVPEEESHHSRLSVPSSPYKDIESSSTDFGPSSGNNGSGEMAASNRNKLPQSSSLNTTQLAVQVVDKSDISEAESLRSGEAVVLVHGYKIKSQYASLLDSIICKHKDIGANCSMKSVTFRSMCMDLVCDVFQTLEKTNLNAITEKELESMIESLSDLQKASVNVGWLTKRLAEILEAKQLARKLMPHSDLKMLHTERLSKVKNIKRQVGEYMKTVEEYKKALTDLDKKIDSAQNDLSVAETEASEIKVSISEIKGKVKTFYCLESLSHGLL